jgi:hypothetical protein
MQEHAHKVVQAMRDFNADERGGASTAPAASSRPQSLLAIRSSTHSVRLGQA